MSVVPPLGGAPIDGRWGQPGRLATGMSASEPICRRIPGRRACTRTLELAYAHPVPARLNGRWSSARPPARSPTRPARTSSRTPTAGSSTSARRSRCGSGCRNYFQNPRGLPPRTAQMVATAETVEWIQVRNEVEALMLEYSLIKQHRPRFNIRLRDDKSYPFLAVTLDDEWPRPDGDAGRASARASATSAPTATPTPSARRSTCCCARSRSARARDNKFDRHERLGRPCLLFHIEKCSGPCVGEIDKRALRRSSSTSCSSSSTATPTRSSSGSRPQMREAADALEFERAARLRDRLTSVRKAIEKQQMVADRNEDLDVDRHRRRRARGRGAGVLRAPGPGRRPQGLRRRQGRGPRRRRELVGRIARGPLRRGPAARRAEAGARARRARRRSTCTSEWLTEQRGSRRRASGCRSGATSARCRRPSTQQRQGGVHPPPAAPGRPTTTAGPGRSTSCRTHLGLPEAPLRIECYDMSHIQGTDYVGSMVVHGGRPARRSASTAASRCRTSPGNDDFAAMEEVLTRRLTAYLAERERAGRRAAGQVLVPAAAAARRRRQGPAQRGRAGARGARPRRGDPGGLAGQAVRGGLSCPAQADPVRIPRQSEALYLLQRIRDEAHRFAITYHRELRGKRMTTSVLDDIPGLGPTRKKRLREGARRRRRR